MHDLKNALRQLAKSPAFAGVAIIILALGIGASTAIFSVVHALLLKPLAYQDARQLVQVQSQHPEQGVSVLAPATFADVARDSRAFAVLAAQQYNYVNLTRTASPARLTTVDATADYFRLFGVAPLLGRTWLPEETVQGATPVAVLGESVWRSQFNARRDIIGETIMLDDVAHTVIGVMPAGFTDPWGNAMIWRPQPMNGPIIQDRSARYWSVFARLNSGVTLEAARRELDTLGRNLAEAHPDHLRGWTLSAEDLQGLVVGDYRSGLLVVLGGVGCVLLITCANVAGLSIVRALGRRKELAVRAALGASRGRLLRQLLAESLVLAVIGGGLGVLVAEWGVDAILAAVGDGWLPRANEIAVNGPVLAAALGLTVATGIAFGLAPAWTASRTDANDALKETRGSAGPAARRLRAGLVVVEIALALILLAGAGLLARSFSGLLAKSPGMRTDQLLSLGVALSGKRYDTPDKRREFYRRSEEAVAAVPGVISAGFTQTMPFTWGIPFALVPVGESEVSERNVPTAFYDSVGADFFKAAGVAMVAGRSFTAADNPSSPPVVIISQATARRFFGSRDPIGRRLRPLDGNQKTEFEIIGVSDDVLRTGLANQEVPLQIYRPLAQRPTAFASLLVHSAIAPEAVAKSVQKAVWSVDPDAPLESVRPVGQLVANSVSQPRLHLMLFGLFAGLALVLAAVGLYGLIAYGVAQRTREFGIRAALGARPAEVVALVLREGAGLIAVGVVLGLIGAIASARLLSQMVFGISTRDPGVFLGVTLLLAFTAAAACLLPARRAMKVNPVDALRSE